MSQGDVMEDYRAQDIAARLRLGSFSVAHVTGEKRPVVFLHVARAEVESLCQQLEGAVEAARAVVRTAQAAFDDVDRGDHADLDPLRLAVRALDRATNGRR